MATEFQTSFIPKQAQQARTSGRRMSSGNFFFGLTTLVFLGVMGFTGAVIAWTNFTQKNIAELEEELKLSQEQYDRRFIEEAARLNTRIETSKFLLARHVAMSGIIDFFENTTSRDVALTSLQIEQNEEGLMKLGAKGVALDYPSIVAQSDAYGQGSLIRDLIFDGLNANEAGLIEFGLSAVADARLSDYNAIISGQVQEVNAGTLRPATEQQVEALAPGAADMQPAAQTAPQAPQAPQQSAPLVPGTGGLVPASQ